MNGQCPLSFTATCFLPVLGSSCYHTNCRISVQSPQSFLSSAALGTVDLSLSLLSKIPSVFCDFCDLHYCHFSFAWLSYLSLCSFGLSMAPLPSHVPQLQAPPGISPRPLVFSFYIGLWFIFVLLINTIVIAIPKSMFPESTFLLKFLVYSPQCITMISNSKYPNLTHHPAPQTKFLPRCLISGCVTTLLEFFQICLFGLISSFVPYISHHVSWIHLCHV